MNLFLLDWNTKKCAQYHFDKHVVKMILELCQLLSTTLHVLLPQKASQYLENGSIYKSTHKNHPCAKWLREHPNNYKFTVTLLNALCKEYTYRYKKVHKCQPMIDFFRTHVPPIKYFEIKDTQLIGPYRVTQPAQAMPEECKVESDAISAYRRYYMSPMKEHLRSWKFRDVPDWFLSP